MSDFDLSDFLSDETPQKKILGTPLSESPLFEQVGKKYGLDPDLLRAWAYQESSFNPKAEVKETGAKGLMQITPSFAKEHKVDPTDAGQSLDAAAKYLKERLDSGDDVPTALKNYFGGESQKEWGPKTAEYPGQVLGRYKELTGREFQDSSGDPFAGLELEGEKTPGTVEVAQPRTTEEKQAQLTHYGPLPPWDANSSLINGLTLGAGERAEALGLSQKTGMPYDYSLAQVHRARQGYLQENPVWGATNEIAGSMVPSMAASALGQEYVLGPLASRLGVAGQILTGPAQRATTFGGAVGNALTRASSGAIQGAEAGALQNGLTDNSFGTDVENGALMGGALNTAIPGIAGAAGFVGRQIDKINPFMTESALDRYAHEALGKSAGGALNLTNTGSSIPGVRPTLAEVTGDPGVAAQARALRKDAATDALFKGREAENAEARADFLEKLTGTPDDLAAQRKYLNSVSPQGILNKGLPVNAKPVVDQIDSVLAGDEGKRTAVAASLARIRGKLVKDSATFTPAKVAPPFGSTQQPRVLAPASSTPETYESDPKLLYNSVRKEIGDMLDGQNPNEADGQRAMAHLLNVKDALDTQMKKSVPGYDSYLTNYRILAQPANAMEFLQKNNLLDKGGAPSLSKIQNLIFKYEKESNSRGLQNAKALTSTDVDNLKTLRDDLLRSENNKLGRGISGNNEEPALGPEWVGGLVGTAASALTGHSEPVGAVVGGAVGKLAHHLVASNRTAINNRLVNMHLDPSLVNPAKLRNIPGIGTGPNPFIPPAVALENRQ